MVTITGRLHQETHWGPPGFGETPSTDSKFTAWIVLLGKPLRIQAGEELGHGKMVKLSKMQIRVHTSAEDKLPHRLGKRVEVSGTLATATTGGDVTPVVLDTDDVRPVRRAADPACRAD